MLLVPEFFFFSPRQSCLPLIACPASWPIKPLLLFSKPRTKTCLFFFVPGSVDGCQVYVAAASKTGNGSPAPLIGKTKKEKVGSWLFLFESITTTYTAAAEAAATPFRHIFSKRGCVGNRKHRAFRNACWMLASLILLFVLALRKQSYPVGGSWERSVQMRRTGIPRQTLGVTRYLPKKRGNT